MDPAPSRIGPRTRGLLEQSSKALVLISATAAVAFQVALATRGWRELLYWSAGAFIAGLVLTRWNRRWGWAALLGTMYLVPVMFQVFAGHQTDHYACVWLAGCLGGLLADQRSLDWSLPPMWKVPLAYWALVVALVWPVLVGREMDYYWPLLTIDRIGNSGLGGPPAVVSLWMLQVALTHMLGLLWFDAAYRHATFDEPVAFTRTVIAPLGVGAFIGCAIAIYQGAVDIYFWSGHNWPTLGRATGSLMDGDAFGVLAGMWTVLFPALALLFWRRSRLVAVACLVAMVAAWGGTWATGSRTALATALMGLMFVGRIAFQRWWTLGVRPRLLSAAAALVIVAAADAAVVHFENINPLTRILETLPAMNAPAIRKFAVDELWNRNGSFGTMTVKILRDYPVTGIGVGCFNHLFTDLAFHLTNWNRHYFDNAQSWYRHQLAELGWLGSLGWIAWVLTFGWLLVRTTGTAATQRAATLVKGALVAIGIISTVSMPTQAFSLSLSVWMFAAWYLHLSPEARARTNAPAALSGTGTWLGAWVLALSFAGMTGCVGWNYLRVPERAVMGEWLYRYGFYSLELAHDGTPFHWTARRAVDVFKVELQPWVKVTIKGGPPDMAERPLGLKMWARGTLIADLTLTNTSPHTWYIKMQQKEHHMRLEIRTSRGWRPVDYGDGPDPREHGVQVEPWTFVDAPPAGAVTVVMPGLAKYPTAER